MPDLTRTRPPAPPATHRRSTYRGLKPAHGIAVTSIVLFCLQLGGALSIGWTATVVWWACFNAAWLLIRFLRIPG